MFPAILPDDIIRIIQTYVPEQYEQFHPKHVCSINTNVEYISEKYPYLTSFISNTIKSLEFLQYSKILNYICLPSYNDSLKPL